MSTYAAILVLPNISYNTGLVVINCYSFFLSGKLFVCPLVLNDTLMGRVILVKVLVFHHFEYFLPISFGL